MSYEDDMYIDEEALDIMLLEHPQLMVKYSQLLSEARMARDLAKESLDLKKAEIDLDIRDDPEKYGLQKITETAVLNTILMEDDFQKSQVKLHKANYEVNILQGVVSAIEARKSALENLVKLYGQNYFAGPSIPHDLTQLRQEKKEEIEHKIGKSVRTIKPK